MSHNKKKSRLINLGMHDCLNGLKPKKRLKPYIYGYGRQYEKEQRQSAGG